MEASAEQYFFAWASEMRSSDWKQMLHSIARKELHYDEPGKTRFPLLRPKLYLPLLGAASYRCAQEKTIALAQSAKTLASIRSKCLRSSESCSKVARSTAKLNGGKRS